MNLKHIFDSRWMIAAVALMLILSGCRINGAKLRGNTVLFLRFPVGTTQEESITLVADHIASRSFLPVTVHTDMNSVILPSSLWNDLENLRQRWCTQPPTMVSITPNDADYLIVLKCEQADEDPRYYIHPSDLSAPLRALIELVPSTADRLLPQ